MIRKGHTMKNANAITFPVGTKLEQTVVETGVVQTWTVEKVEGDVMTMITKQFRGSEHQAHHGGGNVWVIRQIIVDAETGVSTDAAPEKLHYGLFAPEV